MSYINLYIHCVWATKDRFPMLEAGKRPVLFCHMKENALRHRIFIDTIGGYDDHVHCLIKLNATQCVARTLQLIKGESAFWANKNKLFDRPLMWGPGYYAGSVTVTTLATVRRYILQQDIHHKRSGFMEKYLSLLE